MHFCSLLLRLPKRPEQGVLSFVGACVPVLFNIISIAKVTGL